MIRPKKPAGFTLVEVLLIILILTIAGLGGWYVYNENSKKATSTPVASTNKSEANNKSTESKLVYNGNGYSFEYPKDWKVTKLAENECPWGAEDFKADTCPIQFSITPASYNDDEVLKNSPMRGLLITNAEANLSEVYDIYKMQYQDVLKAESMKINGLDSFVVQQKASNYTRSYYVIQLSQNSYLDIFFDHTMGNADNTEYEDTALSIVQSIKSK